jgi:hypothetical protein
MSRTHRAILAGRTLDSDAEDVNVNTLLEAHS